MRTVPGHQPSLKQRRRQHHGGLPRPHTVRGRTVQRGLRQARHIMQIHNICKWPMAYLLVHGVRGATSVGTQQPCAVLADKRRRTKARLWQQARLLAGCSAQHRRHGCSCVHMPCAGNVHTEAFQRSAQDDGRWLRRVPPACRPQEAVVGRAGRQPRGPVPHTQRILP